MTSANRAFGLRHLRLALCHTELASSPTLCRLENRADRETAWAMSRVLVEQFIKSFPAAPTELILDFDAIDDRVHGLQEGRFFHGYYGDWCFLPLYVFCGEQLLVSYLRPSNIDVARHAWAILKLLVRRLREEWPGVKIILRGDSGFCRWKMLRWCERHEVDYIVGLAKNARLLALAAEGMACAAAQWESTKQKQRLFSWLEYGAGSWERARRVIEVPPISWTGRAQSPQKGLRTCPRPIPPMIATSVRKPSTCCSAAAGRSSGSPLSLASQPTPCEPGGTGLWARGAQRRPLRRSRKAVAERPLPIRPGRSGACNVKTNICAASVRS
ncbi:hypothetical protein BH20VER1_BH20VER1_14070 [soil metagenome]